MSGSGGGTSETPTLPSGITRGLRELPPDLRVRSSLQIPVGVRRVTEIPVKVQGVEGDERGLTSVRHDVSVGSGRG